MSNKRGFTIVEVLIGATVLIVGALAFSILTTHTVKFQKMSRSHSEIIRENFAIQNLIKATSKDTILYWMCQDPCHQADLPPPLPGGYLPIQNPPTACNDDSDRGGPGNIKVLHPYIRLNPVTHRCEINPINLTVGPFNLHQPPNVIERRAWRLLANRIQAWTLSSRAGGRQRGNLDQDFFDGPNPQPPPDQKIRAIMGNPLANCISCHNGANPGFAGFTNSDLARNLDFNNFTILFSGVPNPPPVPAPSPYPIVSPFYFGSRLGQKIPRIFLDEVTVGNFVNTIIIDNLFPSSGNIPALGPDAPPGRAIRSELRFTFQSAAAVAAVNNLGDIITVNIRTFQYSWDQNRPINADLNVRPIPDPVPAAYNSEVVIH